MGCASHIYLTKSYAGRPRSVCLHTHYINVIARSTRFYHYLSLGVAPRGTSTQLVRLDIPPDVSGALLSPPIPATPYIFIISRDIYKQDSIMILFRTTIIFLLLTSCGDRIEREKLIGQYAWNDGRIDTLELSADGSYEYWTFAPGRKFANSGKWKLNPILNEVEFELENFPFLTNHVPEGSWFSRLRSRDNEVHLMYTTDSDIYLKKIKPLGCVKN